MTPLPEAESVDAVRRALQPFHLPDARERSYLWEVVAADKVRWDDDASAWFIGKAECILVLDPNHQNLPARREVARLSGCEGTPVAYRCHEEEVRLLFAQPWITDAEFYVLTTDGHFLGMRTHEDSGSTAGMWLPKIETAMHKLYHDFNKCVDSPIEGMVAAPLVCRGTHDDLQWLGLTLTDGMRVLLYMPDIGPEGTPDALEVEATIRHDATRGCFCADFIHEDLMYQTERAKKSPNQPPAPPTLLP